MPGFAARRPRQRHLHLQQGAALNSEAARPPDRRGRTYHEYKPKGRGSSSSNVLHGRFVLRPNGRHPRLGTSRPCRWADDLTVPIAIGAREDLLVDLAAALAPGEPTRLLVIFRIEGYNEFIAHYGFRRDRRAGRPDRRLPAAGERAVELTTARARTSSARSSPAVSTGSRGRSSRQRTPCTTCSACERRLARFRHGCPAARSRRPGRRPGARRRPYDRGRSRHEARVSDRHAVGHAASCVTSLPPAMSRGGPLQATANAA